MRTTHAEASYKSYWAAWLILLGITILMVLVTAPAVLIAGMMVKAAIIALFFMHLRYERLDLTLWIVLLILFLAVLLFGLIVPDAHP